MGFFRKIYNTITCSKPWYYIWELKYKIAFRYIHWLLAQNGITAPEGKDPLWHYLLGDLTDTALSSADGIAVKDLYIIHNRFFKIRGFSLISLTKNEERIKGFCNVNAREAYHILGGLIQLPIINASDWSVQSRHEKNQLTKTLHDNSYRFWVAIKKSCQHLATTWQSQRHLPFNVGMQAFSILGSVLFSVNELPDELFPIIERFEQIWGNPHQFTAQDLRNNVHDFEVISESMHQQRDNASLAKHDLLNNVHQHHQSRKFQLPSPKKINIAAYFAFFENMSKAMLGLFALVFSKKKWLDVINTERARLKNEIKQLGFSTKSKEAFNYVLTHSEVFDRFYMEVLRFWSVAPVLPRINPNVFVNQIAGWGDEMRISDDFTLPPRSLAIVPQYAISRSDEWRNPDQFNPMRNEYCFENINGQPIRSVGKKPLVQGAEGSFRRCPAKETTRKYFYAMLWWFPKYNEINLTKREQQDLKSALSKDAFYRPLTTEKTQQVFGSLKNRAPKMT